MNQEKIKITIGIIRDGEVANFDLEFSSSSPALAADINVEQKLKEDLSKAFNLPISNIIIYKPSFINKG